MSAPTLLLATSSQHKLREMEEILRPLDVRFLTPSEAGTTDTPVEDGDTFRENALIKARYYAAHSGLISIADDSGIEVAALGNEPGVRSSRWAGDEATDADRTALLLERMDGVSNRSARYVCVAAVATPNGEEATFEGAVEGVLAGKPAGAGGFGYDPIMFLPDLGRTVAQLDAHEKNEVSHRGKALRQALPWLQARLNAVRLECRPQDPSADDQQRRG